ncbi:hypothetical protein [Lysinibacter sp. HNR]|uniref:hypothetical protein n=1 Tax=Lysinibacter sp. HNR TaxID=3031408 RepID=UPI00243553C3|nr:hypothetical protein [Lysinibacter sp. HNR]WGD37556.1 hypothetical protein FrondiHNR_01130 [Lysinibacter sp. HNR]
MRIDLDLDPKLIFQLAAVAERENITVAHLIADQLSGVVKNATGSSVARLVRAGLDDGAISVRLGMTRQAVAVSRRHAGLSPNRPQRESQ